MDFLNLDKAYGLLMGKMQGWFESFVSGLPNFILAIIVVLATALAAKLARKLSNKIFDNFVSNVAVANLLSTFVFLGVLVSGSFVALGILHLDKTVTSLLAGAGVIGLALGFAFQEIAANFIAGVFMAFRKPFKIGDLVKIEDVYGEVTHINLRTTTITTLQGLDAIIPNKKLFTTPFVNYTYTDKRRMDLSVGVGYDENLEDVERLTLKCLANLTGRDQSRDIEFYYKEFGDSSINFDVRVWLKFEKETDYLRLRHEAIKTIKKAYDQENIDIPFPIRTLEFGGGTSRTLLEFTGQKPKTDQPKIQ